MDNKKIYRVTLTLSTAVIADNKIDAIMMVDKSLPTEFQFGEFGQVLPFEFGGLDASEITDEDIGRG